MNSTEPEVVDDANASTAEPPKRNRHLQMVLDHLWGPTGSVLFHILLVFMLVKMAITSGEVAPTEIEVTVVEPHAQDLEKFEKELETLPPVENDLKPPDVNSQAAAAQEMAAVSADSGAFGTSTTPSDDLAALDVSSDTTGPLVMKGLFAGRSAAGRSGALGQYNKRWGGATESAVIKALEWLKNHQLADGSWEGMGTAKNKPAMTGLAMLCFLAHGETPSSSERYGPTVDRAIKFLVSCQRPDGSFLPQEAHQNAYANGIALYAISEAYALTRIPSLREIMEKGAAFVVQGQQDTGAYTYSYAKNGRRDTSVAGWQAQALKAAFIAGADVPGLKDAMTKCINGFKMNYKVEGEGGRFKYAPEPGKPDGENPTAACTAIGTLCMQLLGHGGDKEVEGALRVMDEWTCSWQDPKMGGWPMYAWYYITQSKFHKGKGTWDRWNNTFAKETVDRQSPDGSWLGAAENEKGYGPVYGTTLSALSLMVYYRFLPTYKPVEAEVKPTEKSADDVVVEVI